MKLLRYSGPIFLTVASIITLLLTTTPVGAVEGGGIGGRPANPDPSNARTKSIFIYELKAGASKDDAVLLMNSSEKQEKINVYAVDGILTNTGAYSCEQAVEKKDSVGSWIKLSETQVTLPANSTKEIAFTTAVPSSVDVGEHNGCLVFQSATDEGDVQGNVRVRTRQAIRVAVTIPGDLKKEVAIKDFSVDTSGNKQQFLLSVGNTGNVSADIDTRITLETLWGSTVYTDGGGYPVLARNDLQLSFLNEDSPFWGGWYSASAQITYDTRAGVFGVDENGQLVTKQGSAVTVFVNPQPGAWITYFLAVFGLAGLIAFLVTRRRERKDTATWAEYTVKKSDTITSLASEYAISWRLLARANNLKAPYALAKGDHIKVPTKVATEEKKQTRQTKHPASKEG